MGNKISIYFTPLVAKAVALQIAETIMSGDIQMARNRYEMHIEQMNECERDIFGQWIAGFLVQKGYNNAICS